MRDRTLGHLGHHHHPPHHHQLLKAHQSLPHLIKVVQYDMDTDTWTELDQKLETGRHALLTIMVPR